MRTYTIRREADTNKDPLMRPLDALLVSVTLKEDHNTVDGENPIELIVNIQMKNNR